GMRIDLWRRTINAVYLGGLQENIRLQFAGAERGGRVRRHEGIAGAAGENDDTPFLKMPIAAAANVRLGDSLHADGRLQACLALEAFERVLQRQAIQHGSEHAHVVSRRFLDNLAAGAELRAAQDVAAPDHDGQLHAARDDALRLAGDVQGLIDTDAALAGVSEPLAAQFQDDAPILRPQRVVARRFVHEFFQGDRVRTNLFGIIRVPANNGEPPAASYRSALGPRRVLGTPEDYFPFVFGLTLR